MSEYSRVVPPPGEVQETARLLLGLAADPQDVRTVAGGAEFVVPSDVADAYHDKVVPAKRRTTTSKKGGGA
ncbi:MULTISPECIES: hypothetical protein [unclassified Streptomyces]|uniref:hypothetical protein n=1 Tax=unclassified Streptomyces TaxID=2593676 RepID=UPI000B853F18|nr:MULTISPECIES: hypothetical protein [unclassified Streptomyces]MYZ38430.1 hypothetical protein [Streptomyces sp. SID4917]